MENISDVRELKNNQSGLRKRLFDYWIKNAVTNMKLSGEIGFSLLTLKRFLHKEEDLSVVNLFKIKNFLDKKDQDALGNR